MKLDVRLTTLDHQLNDDPFKLGYRELASLVRLQGELDMVTISRGNSIYELRILTNRTEVSLYKKNEEGVFEYERTVIIERTEYRQTD